MDFHNQHLDSIQALRGITALFIILEHIRCFQCGAFGVDIFFCISGFIMMYSTHTSAEHFLAKRLIRILPLYYSMTLFTFLILLVMPQLFETSTANPVFLLKSLLFIPFDIGGGILQPLMRIGWTVNCEIFFYLVFFAALKCSRKYRGLIASGLIIGLVVFNQLSGIHFAPLNFYGDAVMLDFVWGMTAYCLARSIYTLSVKGKVPAAVSYASLALAAVLFTGLMVTKQTTNILELRRPFVWGLPALFIVLCFYTAGLHIPMRKEFITLGNISFSVYLMHYYPILFLDRKIFDFSTFRPLCLLGTAVGIAITVTLSLISYYVIEKAFCGWLRKKIIKNC